MHQGLCIKYNKLISILSYVDVWRKGEEEERYQNYQRVCDTLDTGHLTIIALKGGVMQGVTNNSVFEYYSNSWTE